MSSLTRIPMEAQHVSLHTRRPAAFSEAEWQVRTDLAALYRLIDHFRMTDMIDTHITARLPDENARPSSSTATACCLARCARRIS